MPLLGVIFVVLLAGSVQSISADHESGKGIFKDRSDVVLITTENTNYQVYLQAVLRNGDSQLINVVEDTKAGAYIPHEITDYVFNEKLGEKEVIMIDNIKYEKVQFAVSHVFDEHTSSFHGMWFFPICGEIGGHSDVCLRIFQVDTAWVHIDEDDDVKNHWTILREMN